MSRSSEDAIHCVRKVLESMLMPFPKHLTRAISIEEEVACESQ
jgi:hypothetical protein